jgi:hypothetical protein
MQASSAVMVPAVHRTTARLNPSDRVDHALARLGVRRMGHLVQPGLYALGSPGPDSPVFVSANYTLSFDALRAALEGIAGYILVLDTRGVNVWCAAGEGTFGTDELVTRIEQTGLKQIVRGRTLIVPQLGAPGVSAHEVRKRSGFAVEYGPVRARDLPVYLQTRRATAEMRRVRFSLADRLTVALVDIVPALLPMLVAAAVLFFLGGWRMAGGVVAATLGGVLLFPILLPCLPTRHFSSQGLILGGLVALPFAIWGFVGQAQAALWVRAVGAAGTLAVFAPVTGLLALLFTGSTTFTSRTGVKREIASFIPALAWIFGGGVALTIVSSLVR